MRQFFRNSGVFYLTLVLVTLVLQWVVASSYEEELRSADREAAKPMDDIRNHYTDPSGVPSEIITADLSGLYAKIFENYKKFKDSVVFVQNPEYMLDPKLGYAGVQFPEIVKKFKTRNAKRLKDVSNRVSASFLSGALTEQSVEKANTLLFQASILEELLDRLEKAGVLPVVDSISSNLPREEASPQSAKLISRLLRFPITIEASADPDTLDRLFGALHASGPNKGLFFLEDLEFSHSGDPELWDTKVHAKISIFAISLSLEEMIVSTPVWPQWAAGIGR